jgi:hypothetical protein
LESTKCWYGFIYTRNDSLNKLVEKLVPELEGLEIFGKDNYDLSLLPGTDHIIILRRF